MKKTKNTFRSQRAPSSVESGLLIGPLALDEPINQTLAPHLFRPVCFVLVPNPTPPVHRWEGPEV